MDRHRVPLGLARLPCETSHVWLNISGYAYLLSELKMDLCSPSSIGVVVSTSIGLSRVPGVHGLDEPGRKFRTCLRRVWANAERWGPGAEQSK